MPIRTDDPTPDSQSIVLLVEDEGMLEFLPAILAVSSIAEFDVDVVGGGGWTQVFQKYDELIGAGIAAERIVPILDADTVGQKGPSSAIHKNSSIFRFQFDFEFAFATSECMLLDHALLLLLPPLLGSYDSVSALTTWTQIVREAYVTTAHGKSTILNNVSKELESHLVTRDQSADGVQMPSKVKLATILAKLCLATGAIPREIAELLWTMEARLRNDQYSYGTGNYRARLLWESPLANSMPIRAPAMDGKILVSPNGIGLVIADLSSGGAIRTIPEADDLGWGGWTPDGRIVATVAGGGGVAITTEANAKERALLRHGIHENFLCWNHQDNRVILGGGNAQIFSVSQDNSSWTEIDARGYGHCLSTKGFLAWTANDYRTIYVRRLHESDDDPIRIPDVIDARHCLAWSQRGDELAFVNAHLNDERRGICIWNRTSRETRFIVPWVGKPRFVAWSPDDKYLVVQFEDADGLFAIESRLMPGDTPQEIMRVSDGGGVIRCCAWRN
jgi:hypothetical protein